MVAISAEKTNAIQAIFSRNKAVIGVIHCDPFPGAPKYRGKSVSDIVERALRDAENYISGGVHGLIIRHSAPDLGINLPIALTQYLQNDLLVSC